MEWISVKDRLPETKEAIVYAESGIGMIDVKLLGMDWQDFVCRFNVTHWMCLPEPPKETR